MKRSSILCLLLVLAMIFSLSACGEVAPKTAEEGEPAPADPETETIASETPNPDPLPTEQPVEEATDPRIQAL